MASDGLDDLSTAAGGPRAAPEDDDTGQETGDIELDECGRVSGAWAESTAWLECRALQGALGAGGRGVLRRAAVVLDQAVEASDEAEDGAAERGEGGEGESELDATFWLPADRAARPEGLCALELLAGQIFDAHTAAAGAFDVARSGCEWWVQVRQLEAEADAGESKAKRQRVDSAGARDDEDEGEGSEEDKGDGDGETESIPFHFDKDESLAALAGAYVPPALATVTYLTDAGAPTVVLPFRYCNDTGRLRAERLGGEGRATGVVSFPRAGNHFAFDGRLLHGVPRSLRAGSASGDVRITVLANVWLNHHPIGIEPLPSWLRKRIGGGEVAFDGAAQRVAPEVLAPVQPAVDAHKFRVDEGNVSALVSLPRFGAATSACVEVVEAAGSKQLE